MCFVHAVCVHVLFTLSISKFCQTNFAPPPVLFCNASDVCLAACPVPYHVSPRVLCYRTSSVFCGVSTLSCSESSASCPICSVSSLNCASQVTVCTEMSPVLCCHNILDKRSNAIVEINKQDLNFSAI